MIKKIYVYYLTGCQVGDDIVVVNDPSDNIRLGGFDKNGNWQQYDSQEAYFAYEWAEKHGFTLRMIEKEIEINLSEFK